MCMTLSGYHCRGAGPPGWTAVNLHAEVEAALLSQTDGSFSLVWKAQRVLYVFLMFMNVTHSWFVFLFLFRK